MPSSVLVNKGDVISDQYPERVTFIKTVYLLSVYVQFHEGLRLNYAKMLVLRNNHLNFLSTTKSHLPH